MRKRSDRSKPVNRDCRKMESAALQMLRNAASQANPNLSDDEIVAFATASLGKEHADLVRRVWRDNFVAMGPN